jgi:geranylgeranyl diphosphate synthase type II
MSNIARTIGLSSGSVDVESALRRALAKATGGAAPSGLARAIHHAVFPAGARLRPRLLAAVAHASGDPSTRLVENASAAVELLHCASLVHDDLPCFDGASIRRGRPSVHSAFGEPTAVLVGDALIVHAFEQLAEIAAHGGGALGASVIRAFASAAGAREGLVAGQAWELEPEAPLDRYHRAKTSSLFVLATRVGALLGGSPPERWALVGEHIGTAYQSADDVADAVGDPSTLGKPVGRDEALARPSAVRTLGVEAARARARRAVEEALAAVPSCARADDFRGWLKAQLAVSVLADSAAVS